MMKRYTKVPVLPTTPEGNALVDGLLGGERPRSTHPLADPAFLSGSMWARPVAWRGTGQATGMYRGIWTVLPFGASGAKPPSLYPEDVFGEWELVAPEVVNGERR